MAETQDKTKKDNKKVLTDVEELVEIEKEIKAQKDRLRQKREKLAKKQGDLAKKRLMKISKIISENEQLILMSDNDFTKKLDLLNSMKLFALCYRKTFDEFVANNNKPVEKKKQVNPIDKIMNNVNNLGNQNTQQNSNN